MNEKLYDIVKISDLKDMLNKTKELYGDKVAYKIRDVEKSDESKKEYKTFTHKEVRDMIDYLGTKLIDLGLKGKKIGVIAGKGFLNDEDGNLRVNEYRKATGQDIKDVMELQQYIKASFLNEIGLQANFNMKREAINESEGAMNEEALKPLCDDMKETREEGFNKLKENTKGEVDIKIEFNSSWIARKKLDGVEPKEEETQTEKDKGENEND